MQIVLSTVSELGLPVEENKLEGPHVCNKRNYRAQQQIAVGQVDPSDKSCVATLYHYSFSMQLVHQLLGTCCYGPKHKLPINHGYVYTGDFEGLTDILAT